MWNLRTSLLADRPFFFLSLNLNLQNKQKEQIPETLKYSHTWLTQTVNGPRYQIFPCFFCIFFYWKVTWYSALGFGIAFPRFPWLPVTVLLTVSNVMQLVTPISGEVARPWLWPLPMALTLPLSFPLHLFHLPSLSQLSFLCNWPWEHL